MSVLLCILGSEKREKEAESSLGVSGRHSAGEGGGGGGLSFAHQLCCNYF